MIINELSPSRRAWHLTVAVIPSLACLAFTHIPSPRADNSPHKNAPRTRSFNLLHDNQPHVIEHDGRSRISSIRCNKPVHHAIE